MMRKLSKLQVDRRDSEALRSEVQLELATTRTLVAHGHFDDARVAYDIAQATQRLLAQHRS